MKRAGWLARRLAAMSAGEVAHRAVRESRHGLDDLLYRAARPAWRATWRAPRARGRSPAAPVGFLTSGRAALVSTHAGPEAAEIGAAAERFLAGEVAYFGYPAVTLGDEVDFAQDPATGRRWPDRHGKRLDYRSRSHGDPKWIWELNRLQELPLLAQAWLLTGNDVFAEAVLGHTRRFLANAAPGRGIAWSNGYEAALRAISLALALDALRGSPLLSREDERALVAALWQHRRWIRRDPSTHSSANNHLIGELGALVVISLLVPELERRRSSDAKALTRLAKEAARQIAPDGTSVEQSFAYSLQVIDHFLLVAALLEARGREVPPQIRSALERAAAALSTQLAPEEPPPAYGDADDGRVVRLDGERLRDPRGVAASLAAYLGHPGARRSAERLDTAAVWLFGSDGAQRWAETEAAGPPRSALLPDAGIAVLRSGRRRVLVDAGPLGYLSIAAHGHADALAVALSEGDEQLIVDPGAGSYFGRPELRAAFRGTSMHATVAVDDQDQSVPGGPFLWTRHARARFLRVDLDGNVVAAEHDGYERMAPPVRHRRLVLATGTGPMVVYDRIETRGSHRVTQSWPLAPTLEVVSIDEDTARIARNSAPRMILAVASSAAGTLRAVRGEVEPPRGWYSPRLESVVPAWHLSWEAHIEEDADIVALLWPFEGDAWPQPRPSLSCEHGTVLVGFETASGSQQFELDIETLEFRD